MTSLAEDRKPGDGSAFESGSGPDLHAGKRLGGLRRRDALVQRGLFTGPAGESREGCGGDVRPVPAPGGGAARLGGTAIRRSGARWLSAMLFERWDEALLYRTMGDTAGARADDRMSTSCGGAVRAGVPGMAGTMYAR
jgi:hypothetical protein